MDKRILIAILATIILGVGYYMWSKNDNTPQMTSEPTSTPSVINRMEEVFGSSKVDDEGDKLELAWGNQMALVIRSEDKSQLSVLADLDDPAEDAYYAWLERAGNYQILGQLEAAKGGFVGEFKIDPAWQDANRVIISRESGQPAAPANRFLEGSF